MPRVVSPALDDMDDGAIRIGRVWDNSWCAWVERRGRRVGHRRPTGGEAAVQNIVVCVSVDAYARADILECPGKHGVLVRIIAHPDLDGILGCLADSGSDVF